VVNKHSYMFLHLPKSAGTSFLHGLKHHFCSVSEPFPASYLTAEVAGELDAFTVVAGHISFDDYLQWFPDRNSMTIIRNPVERSLSWYCYARLVVPDSVVTEEVLAAKKYSPEDFFSLDPFVIRRNIINRQTRQLGRHALSIDCDDTGTLSSAINNIEKILWVGSVENLESDLELLRQIPNFENFPELSRTNAVERQFDISVQLRNKIEKLNWADMELYEHYQSKRSDR